LAIDSRSAYEQFHAARSEKPGVHQPWHKLLAPRLKLGGSRVLEIASGRGGFAAWMATREPPDRPSLVVAADFSLNAVTQGIALGARGPLVFAQADIMRLPFAEGMFDAVVSCETLEHVPDPRVAIGELHRVLRPGGVLYITMPNYFSTLGLYRAYRELTRRPWQETGQPINHALRSTRMRRWLRDAGFHIDTMDGASHFLPIPGREPVHTSALDSFRPLRLFAQHIVFVARRRG
jgi:ubiquinone/menaquinone biosynthesis C-methylase UbiE